MTFVPREHLDQPPNLINVFAVHMQKLGELGLAIHWAHSKDFDQTGQADLSLRWVHCYFYSLCYALAYYVYWSFEAYFPPIFHHIWLFFCSYWMRKCLGSGQKLHVGRVGKRETWNSINTHIFFSGIILGQDSERFIDFYAHRKIS